MDRRIRQGYHYTVLSTSAHRRTLGITLGLSLWEAYLIEGSFDLKTSSLRLNSHCL